MIVSAVDLLYVFGRSFVCLPDLPHSGQFGENHVVISSIFGTYDGEYQSTYCNNIPAFILV